MTTTALRTLEAHAWTYRRTWRGTAITTFLNPVLFLLAMGLGLGALVDDARSAALQGMPYLTFLAPGLLAATAMQVAATDSSWPVMAGLRWRKTYQAALATPIRPVDLVVGHLLFTVLRLVLTAVVFVAVMVAFGATTAAAGGGAVLPAVLTGLAHAGPIMAFVALVKGEHALPSLFRFGIMPMFLFSGTFFPVAQLPGWATNAAFAVPLWHGVELCRAAATGGTTAAHPALHLTYLLLWSVLGAVLAARAFHWRLVR